MEITLFNLASHNVNVILKIAIGSLVYVACVGVFYLISTRKFKLLPKLNEKV